MKTVSVRLSDSDEDRLRTLATKHESVSDFIRERIFGARIPAKDDAYERIARLEAAVLASSRRRPPMAQLYEYAVILQEKRDKDGEETEPAQIVVEPTTVLARDEGQAQMLAARAIPEEIVGNGKLDRLVVVVRPF